MPPRSRSASRKPANRRLLSTAFIALASLLLWGLVILGGLRIFLPLSPIISGFPFAARTYLVVLQNDAELRPGGGFISAFATLRFVSGLPVGFAIADGYTMSDLLSSEPPPYPLGEFLSGPYFRGWAFQDLNYSPDFPTNAERLAQAYRSKYPDQNVDGVIAVNFSVIESVSAILGSVPFRGADLPSAQLFPRLEHAVNDIDRHDVEELRTRKDILRPLFTGVLRRALFSPWHYPALSRAINQALEQKAIQVAFINPLLSPRMHARGWDGAFPEPEAGVDTLSVVEANLGGMKSDRFLERSVFSEIDLGRPIEGASLSPQAKVTIRLSHLGDYNEPLSFTYKGYFRILVPPGSRLLPGQGDVRVAQELGYTTFGRTVTLEPGTSTELTFAYSLPADLLSGNRYRLRVIKQSGTDDHYSVAVKTEGDGVWSAPDWESRGNVAVWRGRLTRDQDWSLSLAPDGIAPRVTVQSFRDLTTIELHTNEPVDRRACSQPGNFALRDANVIVPSRLDVPRVVSATCDGRGIRLRLEGVTSQPEERYVLTINTLSDQSGNAQQAAPRSYTVVQRL